MKLFFKTYDLQFKHPFGISKGTRTSTPVVFVELHSDGEIGYGEATLPPYLSYTQESVINCFKDVDLTLFNDPTQTEEILSHVDEISSINLAAKAALDIALHDLKGKLLKTPVSTFFEKKDQKMPLSTYTLGISELEAIPLKLKEAQQFKILKVKLGGGQDKIFIQNLLSQTDKPFCVDVNQGWKDRGYALEMSEWLIENGAFFIEQPFITTDLDSTAWLREKISVPVIADEALQTLKDLEVVKQAYSGINIKLMKCGGIAEAYRIAKRAKELGLKLLIGCMSESSCGVSAAAQICHLTDWADLDGPWLISNDPFSGMTIKDGRVSVPNTPGIGIEPRNSYFDIPYFSIS